VFDPGIIGEPVVLVSIRHGEDAGLMDGMGAIGHVAGYFQGLDQTDQPMGVPQICAAS
jgi:hypothetical protein